MDKLFWTVREKRTKKNAIPIRTPAVEMDNEEIQNHFCTGRG